VKAAALALGVPVADEVDDVLGAVRAGAELGVVVAFGRLIRQNLLAALPFVNLHFSLLPRWRGAAPVERALLAGDTETGVCLMQLEAGLDTGGVYRRVTTAIAPTDTAASLRSRLSTLGTSMLIEALAVGTVEALGSAVPQDGVVSWAAKLEASDYRIDWTLPVEQVDRVVRLGGAWTTFRGKRLKVISAQIVSAQTVVAEADAHAPGAIYGLDVSCGSLALRLQTVQPEGKAPMEASAWRNGVRPAPGERLGDPPFSTET
jgi:methionyl-tRNA formyltransferase